MVELIRKIFDDHDLFPFSLAYKSTKSSQSELPDHFHDWYEIVFVYRGSGTFFVDHTFYDMKQGDLFLIPGNTIHRATPDKETPVTSSAIYFSPAMLQAAQFGDGFSYLQSFEQASALRGYKLATLPHHAQQLAQIFESIQYELLHAIPGYRQAIYLHLLQLLLYVQRDVAATEARTPHVDTLVVPQWMREILLYMDQHYCENISLTTLSKRAAVSPAHFSRAFKQLIGMNFTAYILTKRIIRAKQLLQESDASVQTIAEMCGFESLPHFHAMFKRMLGLTPAAVRKSV
ncbi:AraC family transcriptional regulator [Paenibacillus roseipurpureus]|uniref:AraC family transcriptional regulator n=1 Tax=Paenibacillus roseopurpureus TaxID=2918901 RepID=A0AA96RL79_9BACL|nr:AraC family transcriptional regulator [Paenibacillus sp. MBLB1832]WNR45485.1 AraC family transcriptional regulator [Paenibacillus sp. MBLB1832]